jgi:hypothetical protein
MWLRMRIRLRRIRSPGYAANRLCPLGLAPAPVSHHEMVLSIIYFTKYYSTSRARQKGMTIANWSML